MDRATGHRSFAVFESKYWLPASLLEGGRPKVVEPDAPWVRVWTTQAVPIALFVLDATGASAGGSARVLH